jgi:two-component system CheB/CheR fusion protein
VIVNQNLDVVHIVKKSPYFMALKPGVPSLNLANLLPVGLMETISSLVKRSWTEDKPLRMDKIRVPDVDNETLVRLISVEVIPVSKEESTEFLDERYFVIVFNLEQKLDESLNSVVVDVTAESGDLAETKLISQKVLHLETELKNSKLSLQTTIEQLESANEELQSSYQELLASNEELQSTNEELHSVNEELYTVNAEFQNKIEELSVLETDQQRLLSSAQIGAIFLDRNNCIRKSLGLADDIFNFLPQDIGRPLGQIRSNIEGFDAESLSHLDTSKDRFEFAAKDRRNGQKIYLTYFSSKTTNSREKESSLILIRREI